MKFSGAQLSDIA